jgi:hypothetical protein
MNDAFAGVGEDTLMLAANGVLAGKPLTTGATAAPMETLTSGAFATLVDSGAFTVTTSAFARSAPETNTTPVGANTAGATLTVGETAGTTVGATVGTTVVVAVVGVEAAVGTASGLPPSPPPELGAAGVTDADALDAALLPTLLCAVTLNVYPVPFDRPVTGQLVVLPFAVVHAKDPGELVTVKESILAPPLLEGAVHDTVAD